MSKRIRWLLILLGLSVAVAIVLQVLYSATHHVPAFYRAALAADPQKAAAASDRMLQQTAALASAFKKHGGWETLITAEQINGWLAVDMVKNHPHAVPDLFRNPRVAIDPQQITIASLLEINNYWSVVSLTVEPSLPEPNVLALRIVKARAGLLPVPLRRILDALSAAAHNLHVHLEWRQAGGDPVALLSLPEELAGDRWQVRLEALRLGDGEIYVAGTTAKAIAPVGVKEDPPP